MAGRQKDRRMPGDIRLDPGRHVPQEQPLGEEDRALVGRAYQLFDYCCDKLRAEHDEMRRARQMRGLSQDERSRTAPVSNTLNSCIDNVIADQMDNMPEAKLVPEREETAQSAEEMSDVVSYVLYQSGFNSTYQRLMEDAVVAGTGVAQVFWDEDAENGEGMASVLAWHPEDFYPDPMAEDIQDGRGCFKATNTTVAWVEEHYPKAAGYVHSDDGTRRGEEVTVEAPDGDEHTTLIEFWYRRYDAESRRYRVHMAQLAGGALLCSTQTGYGLEHPEQYKTGVYAHGRLPFVLYRYREVWRRPFGTGLIHDYRETQMAIDRYIKYIDDNARQSSRQRHFIRRGCGIDADTVADYSRDIIEWDGSDIREVMQTVQAQPLNGQVYQMMQYLSDTMKQDCGQNQFARGEGGLGVTAATAIQALQEAGGKITRWHTGQFKEAFREMVEQIMWVLSEYMTPERKLRIVGGWDSTGNMTDRTISLNAPGAVGDALPKPAYTVRVQVQKNNPLQIQADNEFLQQVAQVCAQYGQPLPPESVIGLMEGYRTKSSVLRVVQQNSAQQQEMMQLRQAVEQLSSELEQQKKLSAGLRERIASPGGGVLATGQLSEKEAGQPGGQATARQQMQGRAGAAQDAQPGMMQAPQEEQDQTGMDA